jgi:hypothetical protein
MSGYAHVRNGSDSEVSALYGQVCFAPMNRHRQLDRLRPKSATRGHVPTPAYFVPSSSLAT